MTQLLELIGVDKTYTQRRSLFGRAEQIRILNDVTLHVAQGETLSLVGESGSGKSTTGRIVLKLAAPSAGSITFAGADITEQSRTAARTYRKSVQMIFQDPGGSLNPAYRVGQSIDEPLRIHFPEMDKFARRARIAELLSQVGLDAATAGLRFPHEFSGGQRQRIGIARALAVGPQLIVADEPVSALDVSVQAQVLSLMCELKDRLGLSYLFIAHDLAVVKQMSQRVAVMYRGRIVETAATADLYRDPAHPYTRLLLDAVPQMTVRRRATAAVAPVPESLQGCAFLSHCPRRQPICAESRPINRTIAPGRSVACHLP